jgi:hypothetical protein
VTGRIRAPWALVVAASLLGLVGYSSLQTPAAVQVASPATATATPEVLYPLKVGPTRRYLVDQHNRPFLIAGDSPQSMLVDLSQEQVDQFLANRQRAGFNSVWVNLLCVEYTGGRADATTYDGIGPFTTPGDLSTPNEAYFARADAMLRLAAERGIVVFLDPIETGGWLETLRRNGTAKAAAYGRYLGRRYQGFPNVVWFNGNDFQSWPDPGDDALVLAVARGIKSVDRLHVHTVQLNVEVSSSLDDARWRDVIGLDAAYTYRPTYAEVLKEYARPDHLPVFMVEANYEGEHYYGGPQTLRRQAYWSLLGGAAGQLYGNKYTWPFLQGWQQYLDTVGSRQFTYVTNLFILRRWFDLVPDAGHQVVVSGFGTYTEEGNVDDSDYVTAAATADGTLAIAYLPTSRGVVVDMSRLSGPVRAHWYDPTNGTYLAVAGAPFTNAGTRSFAPPGNNGDGEGDWVLVLTVSREGPVKAAAGWCEQHALDCCADLLLKPRGPDCTVGRLSTAVWKFVRG